MVYYYDNIRDYVVIIDIEGKNLYLIVIKQEYRLCSGKRRM